MPMMSHSGLHGIPWSHCDRCGYQYRMTELVLQRGLLVCVIKCTDNPIAWDRASIIRDILEFGAVTEMQIPELLRRERQDDTFNFET